MPWADGSTGPRTGPQIEAAIRATQAAVPEGYTNAAVNAAITSLGANGGLAALKPGNYAFTAGVAIPRNVFVVMGPGTTITHTGNDAAFTLRDNAAFSPFPNRGVIGNGARIIGNAGASAMGLDIGNSWGAVAAGLSISDYTAGRGIRLYNSDYWTEGTELADLMLRNNAVGVELLRGGGTDSFAYQRWRNVAISVPANGIGIDFGGASGSTVYVYNGDFDGMIWLEGNNATAVKVRAVANIQDSRFNITGEQTGSFTGRLGIDNDGGSLVGYGRIAINAATDDLSAGNTTIRPYPAILDSGNAAGGVTYKQVVTSNPGNRYSGQVGVGVGTNIDLAYVAGYGGAFNNIFEVISVGLGGTPASGTKVLQVAAWGGWILNTGVYVFSDTGAPNGVRSAPVGSLYLRSDGGAGSTLYVKESGGTGNTGWVAK